MSKERTSAIPMESVPDVSSIDDLKRLKQTNPARFEKLMKIDALVRQRMGIDAARPAMTLFKPGHSIRGGRPIGAKNRLQKRFLDDLLEVWEQDGKSALKVAVRQDPQS